MISAHVCSCFTGTELQTNKALLWYISTVIFSYCRYCKHKTHTVSINFGDLRLKKDINILRLVWLLCLFPDELHSDTLSLLAYHLTASHFEYCSHSACRSFMLQLCMPSTSPSPSSPLRFISLIRLVSHQPQSHQPPHPPTSGLLGGFIFLPPRCLWARYPCARDFS